MSEWKPIKTAPSDGTHFLALGVTIADEYDEDDRLIKKNVRDEHIYVAYGLPFVSGFVSFPWNGSIVQNLTFTHWMPLPKKPTALTRNQGE